MHLHTLYTVNLHTFLVVLLHICFISICLLGFYNSYFFQLYVHYNNFLVTIQLMLYVYIRDNLGHVKRQFYLITSYFNLAQLHMALPIPCAFTVAITMITQTQGT